MSLSLPANTRLPRGSDFRRAVPATEMPTVGPAPPPWHISVYFYQAVLLIASVWRAGSAASTCRGPASEMGCQLSYQRTASVLTGSWRPDKKQRLKSLSLMVAFFFASQLTFTLVNTPWALHQKLLLTPFLCFGKEAQCRVPGTHFHPLPSYQATCTPFLLDATCPSGSLVLSLLLLPHPLRPTMS